MYYVYILKSGKDGKLYIGYSDNLRRRLSEHKSGKVTSTKYRLPLELVYYEAYKNIEDAKKRESGIKNSGSVHTGLVKRIRKSIDMGL